MAWRRSCGVASPKTSGKRGNPDHDSRSATRFSNALRIFLVVAATLSSADTIAFAKISQIHEKLYSGGNPVRQARVSLLKCSDDSLYKGSVTTGDDGSFSFQDIDAGDYCLKAEIASSYGTTRIHVDDKTQDQRVDITETIPALTVVDRLFPFAFCLFTILLTIYPIARFPAKPWAFRRDRLCGQLAGNAIELYYKQFRRGATIAGNKVEDTSLIAADYEKAFRAAFNAWYGRRHYIAPLIGLTVLAILGYWACIALWDWISGYRNVESMRGLVAAALAGAFVWIISDEIDRLRRGTSHPATSTITFFGYSFQSLLAGQSRGRK
jgi:hypothetical protein